MRRRRHLEKCVGRQFMAFCFNFVTDIVWLYLAFDWPNLITYIKIVYLLLSWGHLFSYWADLEFNLNSLFRASFMNTIEVCPWRQNQIQKITFLVERFHFKM